MSVSEGLACVDTGGCSTDSTAKIWEQLQQEEAQEAVLRAQREQWDAEVARMLMLEEERDAERQVAARKAREAQVRRCTRVAFPMLRHMLLRCGLVAFHS